MKMSVFSFVAVIAMICGRADAQNKPEFYQRATLKEAFSSFSECLQSEQASCLPSSVSVEGLVVGVDGPRFSRDSLVTRLTSEPSLQCLFWGSSCKASKSECSVLSMIMGSSQYGKPYVYKGHWQAEIRTKISGGICPSETSFIFQLEKGYWKVVAIPFT